MNNRKIRIAVLTVACVGLGFLTVRYPEVAPAVAVGLITLITDIVGTLGAPPV